MTDSSLPLLIEPEQLETMLHSPEILVVDLSRDTVYAQVHVPGAVHLEYSQIIAARPPVMGLLPDAGRLGMVFGGIGLTPGRHVVAYDDEGGGRAARLLWTLAASGHEHYSLLNGGLHAWMKEGYPPDSAPVQVTPSTYDVSPDGTPVAERQFILDHLEDHSVRLLDARSAEEYRGEKKFSARIGHIPGAVNLDWKMLMDKDHNLRLQSESDLRAMLADRKVSEDHTVVAYCQTHHRSALSWFVLNYLGYPDARGYPGSWSDWGNQDNTPVVTGTE